MLLLRSISPSITGPVRIVVVRPELGVAQATPTAPIATTPPSAHRVIDRIIVHLVCRDTWIAARMRRPGRPVALHGTVTGRDAARPPGRETLPGSAPGPDADSRASCRAPDDCTLHLRRRALPGVLTK